MVKLFCAVIGVGSVFPVDIDISETVGDLKDKIKEKKPGLIYFDADLLKLYLAREGNTRDLNNAAYFGHYFERVEEDIHVLVECPDEPDQVNKYKRGHIIAAIAA
ncbi:hypothetical protein PHYSODRAFT_332963 [Phytophthora sojae]|uniref:Crinkler effector protein N-terminal domain-containing protein n=1 Tax=Phytophthora sojae (strain P6497) TaxID=1094619 RepID=G4ZLN0_PHYSP|nr:hypothetical protein PHYSODRAFT_332963 [Phytophthora sojae]EGZ14605.1 hypothetical protein PHYSODRAFT_332963 [Phytophthora sojae]|eukprot:XP_009528354.1 hypothetical protein PHYSODRAFT_332963 [Phytophthora sojae]